MAGRELDIAYGFLDMSAGQNLNVVLGQAKDMAKMHVKLYYFDVLHTPNQTPKALHWLDEIRGILKRHNSLDDDHVIVRLNSNPRKYLRARSELYKKAYERNVNVSERELVPKPVDVSPIIEVPGNG